MIIDAHLNEPEPRSAPRWLAAIFLFVAPLEATWLYLRRHWDDIPYHFPTHWNGHGIADRWAPRTDATVATPLLIAAAIIAIMIAVALYTLFAPMANRQRTTDVVLPTLTAVAWSLSPVFCWIALLPLGGTFSINRLTLILTAHVLIVMAIIIWMSWRLIHHPRPDSARPTDDDSWVGGYLYYNPYDPAVMVPKRIGWGWTLNFGQPAAWWYMVLTLLASAGMIILILMLGRH